MKYVISSIVFCLFITSCSENPASEDTVQEKEAIPEALSDTLTPSTDDTTEIPEGIAYYNNIARFIAGLELDSSAEEFSQFIRIDSWKDYSSQVEKSWLRFEERKLTSIRPWVNQEITERNFYSKNAFYPFSGPDFTYLNAFLPEAQNYYLFGLEPVGRIPNISMLELDSVDQLYAAMSNAIWDNLNLSFFITKKMKEEIDNDQVTGTIPVLLFFMARSGKKILNIEAMRLNSDGEMHIIQNEDDMEKEFENIVEITYTEHGSSVIKKLYYFSMNIADSGFRHHPKMAKFFATLPGDLTSFIKSASYCMHDDKYSEIREVVLKKSKVVIQDDSGIPFRFFEKEQWEHYFYGSYDQPIDAFEQYLQKDYKEAFSVALPLPFRFGYNYPSNLFIAVRK